MIKYKVSVLCIFLMGLCAFNFFNVGANDFPLLGKVIYIDPGHGGVDPGAIYKDLYESKLNLEISYQLSKELEKKGALVYMTRYGDYDLSVKYAVNRKRSDLSRRANIINKSECDLYLSIHLNADTSPTWSGAQVFYDDINDENEKIANIIQKELKAHLRTKRKYEETTSMYLHKRVERPGVLIEVGFITNPNERYLLKKTWYQQKVANVITGGVLKYFETK
ncbi:MAG TPA: N-acetylmuramoyl-L-alanine amidase CwlD [Tenericutes bacterium]|nr:N-acetylmuramoyl-L-alanine amidase CwlD [Mycoplasmatota bacterium]